MYGLLWQDNICLRYNYENLESEGAKKILRKSPLTFVQIKFLAMHITNQKWSFDIFTVENSLYIFMEPDLYLIS